MADNTRNGRRVAKNAVYMFFRMMIVMLVGLYTSRVVLNTLGVNDYGTYNVVGGVVVLFSFLRQAMTNATYRYLTYALGEGDTDKLRNTFVMAINAHWIIAGMILLLTETVGLWLLNNKLVFPDGRLFAANVAYQFSMLSFCMGVMQTPYNSVIIAHERMSFFAVTGIWEVMLKLLLVYLLVALPGDNLINYSWLLAAVSLFMLCWYWIYCRKHFTECSYFRFWDGRLMCSMLRYSGWSVLVNATDIGVTQCMVFFFNTFFGVVANAALGIANNVNNLLTQFLQNFTQAYSPQIFKTYAKRDMPYFHKLLCSTSKLSYYLLFAVSVPVMMNIDFILRIWFGMVPEDTGLFVILVVLFSLVDAYSQPHWIAVYATGKLRIHQIMMSGIKILNIPLAYLLLELEFGAWTALALKAGLNIVCAIVRSIYMKYLVRLSMSMLLKDVLCPVSLVTVLTLPLPLYLCRIMEDGWFKLLATSSLFTVALLVVVPLWGLNGKERDILAEGIRGKLKLIGKG